MEERLQKVLSTAGVCSRRRAETYILQGRVTVNGAVAGLGDRADPTRDTVALDGVPLARPGAFTHLMLYKPRGYVTTLSDEKGRRTVTGLTAGCGVRVWPAGRLDMDSEGLLLLTDDGGLTQHLLHPSHAVEKEYLVWARGPVRAALPALSGPMALDGIKLRPAKARLLWEAEGAGLLSITITEGKNRQVRRMCAAAGLSVTRLKRIREGGLRLDRGLKPGQWRPLTKEEVSLLWRS